MLVCVDSVQPFFFDRLKAARTQHLAFPAGSQTPLSWKCVAGGPWSAEQLVAMALGKALSRGLFSVEFADATTFIRDQGTFVIDTMATIPPKSAVAIKRTVVNLFAGSYAGIVAIVATSSANHRYRDALPPVLPHSLATNHTSKLCEMIHPPHHVCLENAGRTTMQIDQIEEDHRQLWRRLKVRLSSRCCWAGAPTSRQALWSAGHWSKVDLKSYSC